LTKGDQKNVNVVGDPNFRPIAFLDYFGYTDFSRENAPLTLISYCRNPSTHMLALAAVQYCETATNFELFRMLPTLFLLSAILPDLLCRVLLIETKDGHHDGTPAGNQNKDDRKVKNLQTGI
jgi:hypothetical protein